MINKEEIIKELDKQNRKLGEELSLTKDKLNKTLFEKDHYKHLYSEVKKQKDDVVNLLKIKIARFHNEEDYYLTTEDFKDLLRMLGEIDE